MVSRLLHTNISESVNQHTVSTVCFASPGLDIQHSIVNTTLNISILGEPMSDDDIPMERNPVYGASDGIHVLENPAYSLPSGFLPAATPQPPTTATDGDDQQRSDGEYEPVQRSDGEYEPVDCF